jgi:hypothetical protein
MTPARAVRATRRGAPAATSPDRRTAPPTQRIARPRRDAGSPTSALASPLRRTLAPVSAPASGPATGASDPASGALGPAGEALGSASEALGPVAGSLAGALDRLVGRVGGVLPGGLLPVELPLPGGLLTPPTTPPTSRAGPDADLLTNPASAGPARIVPLPVAATSPAAGRSGPPAGGHRGGPRGIASLALDVASGLPAPAGLPAGQDTISSSSATGIGFAALAGALLLFGLRRHAGALAERSGTRSRSYLPLVAPPSGLRRRPGTSRNLAGRSNQ